MLFKKLQRLSSDRKRGSDILRSACTGENIKTVEELILSQDDKPGTHQFQRKNAIQIGTNRRSVQRMKKKLGLVSVKRLGTPQVANSSIERRVHRL